MRVCLLCVVLCGNLLAPAAFGAGKRRNAAAAKFKQGWRHFAGRLLFWSAERGLLRVKDHGERRPFAGPLSILPVELLIPKDLRRHSLETARDSWAIANKLRHVGDFGFDRKKVDAIGFAGLVHDIGKFVIPKGIVDKPGDLDPREWKVMKKHATVGPAIARALFGRRATAFAKTVIEALGSHHEREDGKGYPWGLKGKQIAAAGRVVHVADVRSALAEPRPYHEPLPGAEARQRIAQGEGTEFDPHVARALLEVLNERLARKLGAR